MKFVMSLLLAASFATTAFAADKKSTTVAEKNREEIVMITAVKQSAKERNNERYRLQNLEDPNSESGRNNKSWSVGPWFGSNRERIMTPPELREEELHGKDTTYAGSEVDKNYSTVVGAKLKIKLGAKQ